MLSKKMLGELNKQISREFYNAYLYLSMSTYFHDLKLSGYANWLKVQAQEEIGHAMRIFKYVNEQMGKVDLLEIKQPPTTWKSPLDLFEQAFKAECNNTKEINNLVEIAQKENDFATLSMLQWFVTEQVEEENITDNVVQKLKMVGDNKRGLFIIDKELGGRQPEPQSSGQ